ncbi:hypothetical protein NI17_014210 [Thermobifida halotolerans]|uniref:Uncharacterized protein n=1 Tax=Thermobifida halotolerans TaxID=483545 RepID=A0A399G4M3_9ACTN|nr:hypothetical protein [Thermobifida halotolerans]UOE18008.1 hypothetical protein NI17_014210 [Thermobifida halotolerans]
MRCWHRNDSGGGLVEYAALVLLVCAVAAAAVLLALPRSVADGIARAVCLALRLDDCGPSPAEVADAAYEPERCLQTRVTDVSGYQVEVAVTFGGEFSFVTESFSDGRTHVTLVDTARLEASLGAGAGLNATKAFRLGAEVGVGGGLSFPNGSTWVFAGPEEAERLMADLRLRQRIDIAASVNPLVGRGIDLVWGPEVPAPHITRTGVETEVGVQANAGLSVGDERGGQREGGVEEWSVSPALQAEGAVGVTAVLSESVDSRDGGVATTYSLGGTASIGADWVVGAWRPGGERTGTMTVTRDADGRVTGVRLTQVAASDSGTTVTTTELAVETAEERATAEDWLGLVADDQVLPLTWDSMAPTGLGEDPGPFERWVFERGRTSRVHYSGSDNVHELGGNIRLGVGLGLGGTWGDESLTVTDAEYLGAPVGGIRPYVPYETCA